MGIFFDCKSLWEDFQRGDLITLSQSQETAQIPEKDISVLSW
jgi:hypothetical protein